MSDDYDLQLSAKQDDYDERRRPPEETVARPSRGSTPWQVICRKHGKVALTRDEYVNQMSAADSLWVCPICLRVAPWDDDNYERHSEGE